MLAIMPELLRAYEEIGDAPDMPAKAFVHFEGVSDKTLVEEIVFLQRLLQIANNEACCRLERG